MLYLEFYYLELLKFNTYNICKRNYKTTNHQDLAITKQIGNNNEIVQIKFVST